MAMDAERRFLSCHQSFGRGGHLLWACRWQKRDPVAERPTKTGNRERFLCDSPRDHRSSLACGWAGVS